MESAMRYESYAYLYPPRPEKAIPPNLFAYYQRKGWVAQAKKNGTCNVIAVSPTKELICMNRHREDQKLWAPTPASTAAFKDLPGTGWYVFVAELLHSKVAGGVRDTNYINDILVDDGKYLVGEKFSTRQDLLQARFRRGGQAETDSHWLIDENTWLARNREGKFQQFFDSLDKPEDEGIVLKDPNAALAVCSREKSNVGWSVKSRRTHKNFGF
jgi:hypothetical protein